MISLLIYSLLNLLTVSASVREIKCPQNNKSEELRFGSLTSASRTLAYAHQPQYFRCCATGFSSITWYKNSVELKASDNLPQYRYHSSRQNLNWISWEDEKFIWDSYPWINFTCLVFSVDGMSNISHTISVQLYPPPKLLPTKPHFTIAQASPCVEAGEDLLIYCQLKFSADDSTISRRIIISTENGTRIRFGPRIKGIGFNGTFDKDKHTTDLYINIMNVTSSKLNTNYVCGSAAYHSVKSQLMYVKAGPCELQNKTLTKSTTHESVLSIAVSVPLAVLVVLVVVTAVLLARFHPYINMWIKIKVIQRFNTHTGPLKHRAYLITYKCVTQPAVRDSIEILEKQLQLKICVPDRDFIIGQVALQSISDAIESSECVVIFLCREMFSEKEDDWSAVSLSLAIALNKPLIFIQVGDIPSKILKKNKHIRSALKILGSVTYVSSDSKQRLLQAFSSRFKHDEEKNTTITVVNDGFDESEITNDLSVSGLKK